MSSESNKSLPLQYTLRQPKVGIRRPPVLFLLHGIGSNEKDFSKIAASFDERFMIVSVRAPFAQTAGSCLWYNIERLGGTSMANVTQAEFSRTQLINFIQQGVKTLKVDSSQVYLMGHSQGAVMALMVLLTQPELITGVAAISGQILPEIRSLMAPPERLRDKAVLLVHGLQDAFYPISLGRSASALLSTLPIAMEYYEYYMGHHMTPEILKKAAEWFGKRLDDGGVVGVPEEPVFSVRLGSVHIKVRNLERSIAFYTRYMAMRLIERTGKTYAFLSNDDSHHVLVLQNVGVDAPLALPEHTGLYRITFEVPNLNAFAKALKMLRESNVEVSTIDHMIGWSIHFQDPDGNGVEITLDTRHLPGKSDTWQGRDLPLQPEKILAALVDEEDQPAG